uniref:Uncharacterized protein n=1 Tax=Anopheles darlingi TaxID=43151 RepID=A0A2M4DMZ3_ANODA
MTWWRWRQPDADALVVFFLVAIVKPGRAFVRHSLTPNGTPLSVRLTLIIHVSSILSLVPFYPAKLCFRGLASTIEGSCCCSSCC